MQETSFVNIMQQNSELVKYLFIKYYLWMIHAMPNSKFKEMDNRGGIAANVINKTLVSNTLGVLGSAALTAATGGAFLPLLVGSAITSVTNVVAPVLIEKVSNRAKVGMEKLSDDNMDPIKIAYTLGTENLHLFFKDYYPDQYDHIIEEYEKIKEPKLFPDDGTDMFIKCIYILDTSDDNLISKHSLKANLTEFVKRATVENDNGELIPCIDLYDTVNPVEDMLNKGILDQNSLDFYVQYIDFVINQYYLEENNRIDRLPLFSGDKIKSGFLSIFYEKTRSRFVKKSNARGFFGNIGVSTTVSTVIGNILDIFLGGTSGVILNKFASTTTGLMASNGILSIFQETRFKKSNGYIAKEIAQLSIFRIIQLSKKMSEIYKGLYEQANLTGVDINNRIKFLSKVRFAISRGNIVSLFSKNSSQNLSREITSRNFYHFCLDKNFMTVNQMKEAKTFMEALKTGNTETDYMYLYKNTAGEFEPEAMNLIIKAQTNEEILGKEKDNNVVVSIGVIFTLIGLTNEEKLRFGKRNIFKLSVKCLMNYNLSLFGCTLAVEDVVYVEANSPIEAIVNANLGRNIFGYRRAGSRFTCVSDYARTIRGEPEIYVRDAKNNYIRANTMTPNKIKCIEEKQEEPQKEEELGNDENKKEESEKEEKLENDDKEEPEKEKKLENDDKEEPKKDESKKNDKPNMPSLKDSKEPSKKRTNSEKKEDIKKKPRTAAAKKSNVPAEPLPEILFEKEEDEEVEKEETKNKEEIKKQIEKEQKSFATKNQQEILKKFKTSESVGYPSLP